MAESTQRGNNNAYAQDNDLSWVNWEMRDTALEDFVATLAVWRKEHHQVARSELRHDLGWLTLGGTPMNTAHWADPSLGGFTLEIPGGADALIQISIDRTTRMCTLTPDATRVTPLSGRRAMSADAFTINREGHDIFVRCWQPDTQPRAAVLIAHGLGEHGGRYARVAEALTGAGYVVTAHDHRGHGPSCRPEDLGYFGDKDGWRLCLDDIHAVAERLRSDYPGLPLIFMGHSMGSFVGQSYIAEHGNQLAGAILSGTAGPPPAMLAIGRAVVAFEHWRLGKRGKSKLIQQLLFGAQNDHFKPSRTNHDWLSRDPAEVDKYIADPLCGFPNTTQIAADLTAALANLGSPAMIAAIPKALPLYVFGGDKDPVGATVPQLIERYRAAGVKVTAKLYPDGRHEMLNEINRDEVSADLIAWINATLG